MEHVEIYPRVDIVNRGQIDFIVALNIVRRLCNVDSVIDK